MIQARIQLVLKQIKGNQLNVYSLETKSKVSSSNIKYYGPFPHYSIGKAPNQRFVTVLDKQLLISQSINDYFQNGFSIQIDGILNSVSADQIDSTTFYQVKNCELCFIISLKQDLKIISFRLSDDYKSIQDYKLIVLSKYYPSNPINDIIYDPIKLNDNLFVGIIASDRTLKLLNISTNVIQEISLGDINYYKQFLSTDDQQSFIFNPQSLIFNLSSQKMYAIDSIGYVIEWNISNLKQCLSMQKPTFKFTDVSKNQEIQTACSSGYLSLIDEINGQLVFYCSNKYLINYGISQKTANYILQTNTPQDQAHIKLFQLQDTSIIISGNTNNGQIQFYKLNKDTQKYEQMLSSSYNKTEQYQPISFLQINNNQFKIYLGNEDIMINIPQINNDNTISNFEFNLQIDNGSQTIGTGTKNDPFKLSSCMLYISSQVNKYMSHLNLSKFQVDINILQGTKEITWKRSFNIQEKQNKSIVFRINGEQGDKKNRLTWSHNTQPFTFSSLYSIEINNMEIYFMNKFGMYFNDISNSAVLTNVEMVQKVDQSQRSVFYVESQSNVIINNLTIKSETINEEKRFYILSTQLTLNNVQIIDCTFSGPFVFVEQMNSMDAQLMQYNNIKILNNQCNFDDPSKFPSKSYIFSGVQTQMDTLEISNNSLCNLSIYQSSSFKSNSLKVTASNIIMSSNTFYFQEDYLFLKAEVVCSDKQDNIIKISSSNFENNNLDVSSLANQNSMPLFHLLKFNNYQFENIKFHNHYEVSFLSANKGDQLIINNLTCDNESSYQDSKSKDMVSGFCLGISNFKSVNIIELHIENKRAKEQDLCFIENSLQKISKVTIYDSTFKNLQLVQLNPRRTSNPLIITSSKESSIVLENLQFQNNQLKGSLSTLFQSTTAITIYNVGGMTTLKNCKFFDSSSNTKYNFLLVTSDYLTINDSHFSGSSFEDNKYLQQGGQLRVSTQSLILSNTTMERGTSQIGTFVYLDSYGTDLQIYMSDVTFEEGYSSVDGSGLFIDSSFQQINLMCFNCQFRNLFLNSTNGSALKIKYQTKMENFLSLNNQIYMDGGSIVNVFGGEGSKFLEVISTYLVMVGFSEISFNDDPIIKSSRLLADAQNVNQIRESTILRLVESPEMIIRSVDISNIQNNDIKFIFLESERSPRLTIANAKFNNIIFQNYLIQLEQSNLVISSSQFENIKQNITDSKNIQSKNSMIQVKNKSQLTVNSVTSFDTIECTQNCQGSAINIYLSSASIQNTQFVNCKGVEGGAVYIDGLINDVDISNSFFNRNEAKFGGALYINSIGTLAFNITSVEFFVNHAESEGGAIYAATNLDSTSSSLLKLSISKSNFYENSSKIGPVIRAIKFKPEMDDITQKQMIQNLSTTNSSLIQTDPICLNITNIQALEQIYPSLSLDQNKIIFNDFRSGDRIDEIRFILSDDTYSLLKLENNTKNDLGINYNITQFKGNRKNYQIKEDELKITYDSSTYEFVVKDLVLVGTPGQQMTISLKQSNIKLYDKSTEQMSETYTFDVVINFRKCILGEKEYNYSTFTECINCADNTYSKDGETCLDCPFGAQCSQKTGMSAISGFWRKDEQSIDFLSCYNQEDNCKGGKYGNNVCKEGHIGALCESCDIYGEQWGQSYTKSSAFSCISCDNISNNSWVIVLAVSFGLTALLLVVRGDYRKLNTFQDKEIISIIIHNQPVPSNQAQALLYQKKYIQKQELQASYMIKIFTNYFQIISFIFSLNLSLPDGIQMLLQTIGLPLQSILKSFACSLVDTDIPIIYLNLIFSQILVLIYISLIIGFLMIYKLITKSKQFNYSFLASSILFVFLFVYPDMFWQIIALISCRKIGDTEYIVADVSYECYNDEHSSYFVKIILPILILWFAIIPLGLLVRIFYLRKNLSQNNVERTYGFLYREYNESSFYWEFVKMLQKLVIILVLNLYFKDVVIKGFLVLIIILIYGIATAIKKPYKNKWTRDQDLYSSVICFTTIFLAIFIYNNPYDYFEVISYVLMIIINLTFILSLIKPTFKYFAILLITKYKEQFKNIKYLKKYLEEIVVSDNLSSEEKVEDEKKRNLFRKAKLSLNSFFSKSLEEKIQQLKQLQQLFQEKDNVSIDKNLLQVDQNIQLNLKSPQKDNKDISRNSEKEKLDNSIAQENNINLNESVYKRVNEINLPTVVPSQNAIYNTMNCLDRKGSVSFNYFNKKNIRDDDDELDAQVN